MKVFLKCFSTLSNLDTCDFKKATAYDLEEGQTLNDLLDQAGIHRDEVKIAFVNSRIVASGAILVDGDHVGLSPAVGGM